METELTSNPTQTPLKEIQHVYCIAGLGADFRIFQKIKIEHAELHPVNWIMPEDNETLQEFAKRLSRQITHENPILLGVSFGGMLATEISKIIPVKKAIVISTCKQPCEMPVHLKLAGKYSLHKRVPYWKILHNNRLNKFIFDVRSPEEETYIKQLMLKESQIDFVRRCVNMILNWKSDNISPENVVHIHGRTDRLLTPGRVKADHWIDQGGHFMIWNRAPEVNAIINKELA